MSVRVVAAVCFFAVAAGGCLAARRVQRNERPGPPSDEGYVAIGVVVERPDTLTANFCENGNVQKCFNTAAMTTDDGFAVYAVPAGNYCLTQMVAQDGATVLDMMLERKHMRCFAVEAGAMNYPGHLELQVRTTQFAATGVRHAFVVHDGAQALLAATYPALAALPLKTPTTTAAPPDPMMQMR